MLELSVKEQSFISHIKDLDAEMPGGNSHCRAFAWTATGGVGLCTRNASTNARLKPRRYELEFFFNAEMKQQKLMEVLMFPLKAMLALALNRCPMFQRNGRFGTSSRLANLIMASSAVMEQPCLAIIGSAVGTSFPSLIWGTAEQGAARVPAVLY